MRPVTSDLQQASAVERDPRWASVLARSPAADGSFFYSVSTTGVYCRPSCRARLARPEHVRFHATREDAELAGFRPCKRCRPDRLSAAEATEIRFAVGASALGCLLVARAGRGVCAILLGDHPEALARELAARFPAATLIEDDGVAWLTSQVARFVEAPGRGLELELDPRGTPFQQEVWQALREIPAGTTASYAEIARRIGAPASARAVAQACAANLLAVAIPCHRVVRSDGGLSGYRWGVERKRALLEREASV